MARCSQVDDADLVATKPGTAPANDGFTPHDRYVLIERLGHGGMGTVWAAHDKVLDRTVALKVLHDEFLGAEDQARLLAEARAMARLSHRNVVDVYDVSEKDGRTYLTMELVRGISLDKWLLASRDWRAIVAIFRAAASGLAAAHEAGIIHRDVKPANILVGDDGEVRVADFGVAHASAAKPDLGATPTAVTVGMIGTLAYMSPEQLRGRPADARSDQFSFFSSLYEALHGKRPFLGADVAEQIAMIEKGCPPPASDTPAWLHEAIARGVVADPDERFPSMTDAAAALAGPRSRRWLYAGGAATVVAAVAIIALASRSSEAPGRSCLGPRDLLAKTWSPAVEAQPRAAFASIGAPFALEAWQRISTELDERAGRWAVRASAACHSGDARAITCSSEQGELIRALAGRLGANIDRATATRTVEMFAALPDLDDCTPSASRDLAMARADLAVGPTREGLHVAARAAEDPDPATALAASLAHARLRVALGDVDAGLAELDAVAARAAIDKARGVEIDAQLAMARALIDRAHLADAQAQVVLALAVDGDPRRTAQTYALSGELAHLRDDEATSLAHLEKAAQLASTYERALWTLPIHDALARAYLRANRAEDALATTKRVVDLARMLGESHPAYGRAVALSGFVNVAFGRIDKAHTKAVAAQRIATDTYGPEHLDLADVHDIFAAVAVAEGDDPLAETHLRASLALREKLAPRAEATFATKKALAKVLDRLGRR